MDRIENMIEDKGHARMSLLRGIVAISPIIVFLIVYLLSSIICHDFYKMPLSVAFVVASVWAALTLWGVPISQRVEIFSKGAGTSDVIYMIWIFILAGAFAAMAKATGAVEVTVGATLNFLPDYLVVPGLFATTCFISMAIGTSVGTVVALTPLAVDMANAVGEPVAFFIAIVLGGAFFGDNLSFISDTTIAATRTQGCDMRHKFLANIKIVLPAAIISLILYCFMSPEIHHAHIDSSLPIWLIMPYLVVIGLALIGLNVTIVLLSGIVSVILCAIAQSMPFFSILSVAGEGIDSVGSLIIITLLASGMLGIIKYNGGIDFILRQITRRVKSARGAQTAIVALVGLVDICTANNTVAIITVGDISRRIAQKYDITPRKSASLLDTGSCIVQSLIPYGAQTLMATSLSGISPVAPLQYMFYPLVLAICVAVSIIFTKTKR